MCGIIGVTGASDPAAVVLRGLEILEYRGYDSAGIAIAEPGAPQVWRRRVAERARSLAVLGPLLADAPVGSAVGHTRWATHGGPTEGNAHPHLDCTGRIALVHNGIIENHRILAAGLVDAGHTLASETDTEVVAHLLEDRIADGLGLAEAVRVTIPLLEGDFAFAVVAVDEPEVLVAARRAAPLIVGVTPTAGVVGSDIAALLSVTRDLYLLEDDEVAEVRPGAIVVTDGAGNVVLPERLTVTWSVEDAQKDGYPDYMSKEIREQPRAVAETLFGRVRADGSTEIEELAIPEEQLVGIDRVVLVACGSSYHTSLLGRIAIERLARLPAEVEIASEFRFRDTVLDAHTLVVVVSQSGETLDTLHALRHARALGAVTIAMTNVVDSVMAREADGVLYTHAGPEIGVAGTKCTLAQIALLGAFALHLARIRGVGSTAERAHEADELLAAPTLLGEVLERVPTYEATAARFAAYEHVFFLGRQSGFPIALEGALKLKELAYVRAEAYPAGELKHGPIALIDDSSLVIAVITNPAMREKVLANVAEVRARGAVVIAVGVDGDDGVAEVADAVFAVPAAGSLVEPMVDIVPLQCLAYAIATARGNDVDRPRNLAKVVTVE
jgi:glucosamine--fructose-6-phosphate aminotransferase (isomerizing)